MKAVFDDSIFQPSKSDGDQGTAPRWLVFCNLMFLESYLVSACVSLCQPASYLQQCSKVITFLFASYRPHRGKLQSVTSIVMNIASDNNAHEQIHNPLKIQHLWYFTVFTHTAITSGGICCLHKYGRRGKYCPVMVGKVVTIITLGQL